MSQPAHVKTSKDTPFPTHEAWCWRPGELRSMQKPVPVRKKRPRCWLRIDAVASAYRLENIWHGGLRP